MKYMHWQERVEAVVLNKREPFSLTDVARQLNLKKKNYKNKGKTFKQYERISSVNYQLMRLVEQGLLRKVGTYYMTNKIGFTALRGLISYARRFINKFEKLHQSLFKKTVELTRKFYKAMIKLVTG